MTIGSSFDDLCVVISGPTTEVARFQQLLEGLNGQLNLSTGQGADTGADGFAVLRWHGRQSDGQIVFGSRSPRKSRKVNKKL